MLVYISNGVKAIARSASSDLPTVTVGAISDGLRTLKHTFLRSVPRTVRGGISLFSIQLISQPASLKFSLFFLSLMLTSCVSLRNTCLIDAVKAKDALPKTVWSRIVMLRISRIRLCHCYLVFDVGAGNLYAWDSSGSHAVGNSKALGEIGFHLASRYGYFATSDYEINFADAAPSEYPVIVRSTHKALK